MLIPFNNPILYFYRFIHFLTHIFYSRNEFYLFVKTIDIKPIDIKPYILKKMLAIEITTVTEKDHTHKKKADSSSSNVTNLHFLLNFHWISIKLNSTQRNVYFLNQMGFIFFLAAASLWQFSSKILSKNVCPIGQAQWEIFPGKGESAQCTKVLIASEKAPPPRVKKN